MTASARFFGLMVVGAALAACDGAPLGVAPEGTRAGGVARDPVYAASAAGTTKSLIAGTIGFVGLDGGTIRSTPSGRCHATGVPVAIDFTGDVSGVVTITENEQYPCDFHDLVGSGRLSGDLTWNGRTGPVTGQWTTNCNPDASLPLGLSCDGVMNLRGSGALEGVQFHLRWGPGWYPFPYSGTAFES